MPKKRGRPPKSTPQSSNKQHDSPSREVLDPQPSDLTQIDDDDLAMINNLSPKQAEVWLKNLDVLCERIKGKSVVIDEAIEKLAKGNANPNIENQPETIENMKPNHWVEKKKPTQAEVQQLDDALKLQKNIEEGIVPQDNVESARHAAETVINDLSVSQQPDKDKQKETLTEAPRTIVQTRSRAQVRIVEQRGESSQHHPNG
ncbi:hypothetical protein RIF29_20559 [Crotalaria pallida]|uniref:Uncharacterized protein n=1 Tax=Crotalaria pallida TaxID=3830 RepID=A0AAN9I7L3_CROPI